MTSPETPLDLDAIRARAAAATPGPWIGETYRSVLAGLATSTGNHGADASFVRAARTDVTVLLAEVERLRSRLDAVEALLPTSDLEPGPNGTLVIVGTRGGHQNLPYKERVYARFDRPDEDGPHPDGDWYQIDGDSEHPLSWGELNWLDDPACDRGSVHIEAYVPVDEIERALAGGAS